MNTQEYQHNGLPSKSLLREAHQAALKEALCSGLLTSGSIAVAAIVGYLSISYILDYSPELPVGPLGLRHRGAMSVFNVVLRDLLPPGRLSWPVGGCVLALAAAIGFIVLFNSFSVHLSNLWSKPGRTPEETAKIFYGGLGDQPRHQYSSWICLHTSAKKKHQPDQDLSDYSNSIKYWSLNFFTKHENQACIVREVTRMEEQDDRCRVKVSLELWERGVESRLFTDTRDMRKIGDYWYVLDGRFYRDSALAT